MDAIEREQPITSKQEEDCFGEQSRIWADELKGFGSLNDPIEDCSVNCEQEVNTEARPPEQRRKVFVEGKNAAPLVEDGKSCEYPQCSTSSSTQNVGQENIFMCEVCNFIYFTQARLDKHMLTHSAETPHVCTECDFRTNFECDLEKHMESHVSSNSCSCSICGYQCTDLSTLSEHMTSHESYSPTKEVECDLSWDYETDSSNNDNFYFSSFASENSCTHTDQFLNNEPQNQVEENYYKCAECSFDCDSKTILRIHMKIHANNRFVCMECGYTCSAANTLRYHSMRHTGEKPVSCSECDYRCKTNGDLRKHLRTHTGEKRFACSECGYKCSAGADLRRHSRIHSGEKVFSCTECDYRSITSSAMKCHKMKHTGEKPYACSKCNYKCTRPLNLKNHQIVRHTGAKTFNCSQCDYKSYDENNFNIHMATHRGDKLYACRLCGSRFGRLLDLKNHVKAHRIL